MMKSVFAIIRAYQSTDGDGWYHWPSFEQLGLYSTRELANDAVAVLIQREVQRFDLITNPSDGDRVALDQTRKNAVMITTGNSVHNYVDEAYHLFDVKEIMLNPVFTLDEQE